MRCQPVAYEVLLNDAINQLRCIGMHVKPFKGPLVVNDRKCSSSSSGMRLSGTSMEYILNKAVDLRVIKIFLHDFTAIEVEKNRSWRARKMQKIK